MFEYLDDEEKELIESLHSEDWNINPNKEVNKIYEEYAKYGNEVKNKIEIQLSDYDLQLIEENALKKGMTSQSMIRLLVHKFNEGEITI